MVSKGYKQSEEHKLKKAISKKRGSFFSCLICGSEFWRQPAAIKKGDCKFCSRECYQKWQMGRTKTQHWKQKRMENNLNKAKHLDKRKFRKFLMSTNKYKNWRKSVFERDNWTCRDCGKRSKRGEFVRIEAHHIKPFSLYPEERFNVENGITLCKPCHDLKPKGREIYVSN